LKEAKQILMDVIEKNEYALKNPAPQVVVTELGDSAVNLSVRVTTSNEHFWTMNEQLIIDCKSALDSAGIEIPFPQRDIRNQNQLAGILLNRFVKKTVVYHVKQLFFYDYYFNLLFVLLLMYIAFFSCKMISINR